MRILSVLLLGVALISSCKKDPPKPPEKVLLTSPAKNSECTPIRSTNTTSNAVQFNWQAAKFAESYDLSVTNLDTGTSQRELDLRATTHIFSLQKGALYSWSVVSRNSQTETTALSASWLFYNPGSQTTYAPFPAEVISPKPGSTVFKDINNEVTLSWSGADIDNDIESYEIYFSTENPPEVLIDSPTANTTEKKVSVASNTIYYWKVITKDIAGNTADTGILDFRCR